jgi:hypothetical protein
VPKPKIIKPERVAGIVALSYLVLIPVGAYMIMRGIKKTYLAIDAIWDVLENENVINRQFRNDE